MKVAIDEKKEKITRRACMSSYNKKPNHTARHALLHVIAILGSMWIEGSEVKVAAYMHPTLQPKQESSDTRRHRMHKAGA